MTVSLLLRGTAYLALMNADDSGQGLVPDGGEVHRINLDLPTVEPFRG